MEERGVEWQRRPMASERLTYFAAGLMAAWSVSQTTYVYKNSWFYLIDAALIIAILASIKWAKPWRPRNPTG